MWHQKVPKKERETVIYKRRIQNPELSTVTIFANKPILDVWLVFECASALTELGGNKYP